MRAQRGAARRVRRRWPVVAITAIALVASVGAYVASRRVVSDDEERLLRAQARDAAATLNAIIGQTRAQLGSVGAVGAATGGDQAALERLVATSSQTAFYASIELLRRDGTGAVTVTAATGDPRADVTRLTGPAAAALGRAFDRGGLVIVGFQGSGDGRRIGFALGRPDVPGDYVVYAEAPLPQGTTIESPFPDIDFALYAGRTEQTGSLIFSSSDRLPLSGRRENVVLELGRGSTAAAEGAEPALFVVAGRGSLAGGLASHLPWILLAAGLVSGAAAVTIVLLLQRRRDAAEAQNRALVAAAAERERLEDELRRAQRLESVGQLAGGVAHDFNNLLAVILSYTDFVVGELPHDHELQADLAEVHKAATRAADLTHQLLVFSRRDAVQPDVIDVHESIADGARLLERTLGEHCSVECRLQARASTVLADRGELQQVVMNLALNARDALGDGGTILIETDDVQIGDEPSHVDLPPGHYVRISVSDTGHGMTPEVAARAFEPFFTTKGPGSGTGLGLSTVYGIARRREGQVALYSEPGVGTTIRVYLPLVDAPPPLPAVADPVPPARAGGGRILLVEDEDAVRRAARRILERAGYDVLEASDGPSALRAFDLAGGTVDVVVTDMVMPGGMMGTQLADELRRRSPGIRVLLISGYSAGMVSADGDGRDGVHLVEKPFTDASLLAGVHDVLG